ncbi:N-acetylmuramoyl-L-alanine amidase [Hoeflea sp. G2-23]|uniref:N-acetylmuramoyl-L-alanine amidase n=1 Tax=Hoeflea algicola TaxID=2983763 RepID=A0ABT3Z464_9HYPH|nr:N-acetylmuramoyl-L-alanine amidase [Hoeflea algicola]MCY0146561.1 N-acetylmuramoyl-L-alanine amidase [Hoeflea algicola]
MTGADVQGWRRCLWTCCLLVTVACVPALARDDPQSADRQPLVAIDARIAGDENRVRLVMDFEGESDFKLRYLAEPNRVVIDLPETVFAFENKSLVARGLISAVRYGKSGEGRARMVFGLAAPARFELADTSEEAGGSIHRLVFDAVTVDAQTFAAQVDDSDWLEPDLKGPADRNASAASDTLTIVIDPGHGGIDGGAEGADGSMEKNISLAFAEALKRALEQEDGIRVAMTRTDDTFLSLSARVRKAREEKADLLISLHADSIRVRSLRGATVYTLSDKASDVLAQSLADQENRDDVLAGGASLDEAPEAVAAILVDLARTETRVFSSDLAQEVIHSFEGQVKLINNPHRQAGFKVLQAPDVPSVLVELGYLSNSEDEKLLTDETWRKNTARLLAQSVHKYRQTILAGRH